MSPLHRRAAAALAALVLGGVLTVTSSQAHSTPAAATAPVQQVERLWAVDGDDQQAPAGQAVPTRLKVRAVDHDRHPVAGATVRFSTPGPTFPDGTTDATAVTDPDGYATAPPLTAAATPGPDLVTVSSGPRAQVAFEITTT